MHMTKDRLDSINAVGGLRIDVKDAVFIIKSSRSVQWGENVNINSKSAKWYDYDALLVVTNLAVMKLAWFGKVDRPIHDSIVDEVRRGNVKNIVELCTLIGRHARRYGATVMLTETKLERYYD